MVYSRTKMLSELPYTIGLLLVDEGAGLVIQGFFCSCLLLGDAGTVAAGLLQFWPASVPSSPDICKCVYVKRPEVILRRLSEIDLKRSGYDFCKLVLKRAVWESFSDWLETGIGCAVFGDIIGWIPRWRLAVGRGADFLPPCSYAPPMVDLVSGCCVCIGARNFVLYGLRGENSVLPKAGSISFKYK